MFLCLLFVNNSKEQNDFIKSSISVSVKLVFKFGTGSGQVSDEKLKKLQAFFFQ